MSPSLEYSSNTLDRFLGKVVALTVLSPMYLPPHICKASISLAVGLLLHSLALPHLVCAEMPGELAALSVSSYLEVLLPLPPSDYRQLLKMSPEELAGVDVARINLLFAADLPGSEGLDIDAALKTLDEMARYVQKRTKELKPKFTAHPEAFSDSEAFFKMTVLVSVLQKEKGLIYDPKFSIRPGAGYDQAAQEEISKSSKHVFINGLLNTDPAEHLGTCSSMPVLWTAVGRRLGYPLSLVHAKKHLFVRWEDKKDRFNVEASQGVMASPPDEEYKTWPFPLTEREIAHGPYLKSLTPVEELADAMNARFWVLMHYQQFDEALKLALKLRQMLPQADKYLALVNAAGTLLPASPSAVEIPPDPSPIMPNPLVEMQRTTPLPGAARFSGISEEMIPFLPPQVRQALGIPEPDYAIPGMSDQVAKTLPPHVRAILQKQFK